MAKKFRIRFRLMHGSFISLLDEIKAHELFSMLSKTDEVGESSYGMKLLLLLFLCCIGRAWALDNVEEANGISREASRILPSTLLEHGSTSLYTKLVAVPVLNRSISG